MAESVTPSPSLQRGRAKKERKSEEREEEQGASLQRGLASDFTATFSSLNVSYLSFINMFASFPHREMQQLHLYPHFRPLLEFKGRTFQKKIDL